MIKVGMNPNKTGLRVQLEYDEVGTGNLERITNPDGYVQEFTYYSNVSLKYSRSTTDL